jgi:hypothetical protein
MGAHFPVVVVDDGELDEVREILLELGVEFAHLRGGAVPSQLEPPRDLFIATIRHAGLARNWPLGSDERPVRIAVTSEDSTSARNALRKMGFSYLVRRPVHAVALRLVLLRALYRGEERRREPRVPVGFDVSVRSGLRRREALLVDLSSHGCRLLTDRVVAESSKLTLHLPAQLAGDDTMALSGRVVRCVADKSSPLDGCYSVAVQFTSMPDCDRERLERALAAHAQALEPSARAEASEPAPPRKRRAARAAKTRTPGTEPVVEKAPAGAKAAASRTDSAPRGPAPPPAAQRAPRDRRRFPRVHYERRVIAAAEEAMHRMLIGHDLSLGGMRIGHHPELRVGQRLRIALYDAALVTPVVVVAAVARDDGEQGMALRFEEIDDEIAARLERLVAALPPVECLGDGESGALGTVVSEIV